MSVPKVLVCLANGVEEMEAVTAMDMLKRAGFQVTSASANPDGSLTIQGAQGICLIADCPLVKVADEEFDCIVLPGGAKGATTLGESALVIEMLKQQQRDQKWVAAICAAPALVIEKNNLFIDAHKTCHPFFKESIQNDKYNTKRVYNAYDHHLITSQGPGTAIEFAVEIIFVLAGKDVARKVVEPMVLLPHLHYDKRFATTNLA